MHRSLLVPVAAALLLAGSLCAQIPDFTPPNPLFRAVMRDDAASVERLLKSGADPNKGNVAGLSMMIHALAQNNIRVIDLLVQHGAELKPDFTGSTPLMWASANEKGQAAVVELLLKRGQDPNTRNKIGESALDWALRRGHTPAVEALLRAGAKESAMSDKSTQDAIARSLKLLQTSGQQFVKVSGCSSCHHQSLPQMAYGLARERSIAVDETISATQTKVVASAYKPAEKAMAAGHESIPDIAVTVSYALLGLAAEKYPADSLTAAMAHVVATQQTADGSFAVLPARPPMESSRITSTTLSLRALQLYGAGEQARIRNAGGWLVKAEAFSTEDRAMRLLGLYWSGEKHSHLEKAARDLLRTQRPDGSWAQLDSLDSDAYATGQALVSLRMSGFLTSAQPGYIKGKAYLLRTQKADGSWHVRTRSFPFQPLKDSGFPHGRDQWISAAGTSWAAMALTLGLPSKAPAPLQSRMTMPTESYSHLSGR